ncbi:hypothetical protein FWF74_01995 [Candidatus Saccharibacteria bacterium]|nr:hypothetical protein [Candidatus Saccharibacteria bacterium]MCL1963267.1 hypothetical protein [Candidatus Saccharibacteria bacterium]
MTVEIVDGNTYCRAPEEVLMKDINLCPAKEQCQKAIKEECAGVAFGMCCRDLYGATIGVDNLLADNKKTYGNIHITSGTQARLGQEILTSFQKATEAQRLMSQCLDNFAGDSNPSE